MADIGNSTLLKFDAGILPKNACVVLVKTEWNAAVVDELEAGCVRELQTHGVEQIKTLVVPGAVEIPFAIKRYHDQTFLGDRAHAFIALGCVIRGDTPHFEYVCNMVTQGIMQLNLQLEVPVIFGVLTVNTQQQADERIGGIHGHKGAEAGMTALKMMALNKSL